MPIQYSDILPKYETSMTPILLNAATLTLCLAAGNAWSWGSDGHQLVARIAQSQLTSKAQQGVQALLDQEPGSTLTSISTWADEVRNPATAPWHYLNFPKGDCNYLAERDCPNGNCVVEAINRQVEVLKTESDPQKRLLALKYVVHLVGDVHQPLHAGWGEDRGGNSYQLQAFMRGSNCMPSGTAG